MPGYYLIDDRTKTITPVTEEDYEERRRIESSTRRIVPAYSSEVQRYLRMGYRLKNPYMGFRKLVSALRKRGAEDARALAAWIGRRKYGKERFQKMAADGRRRNPGSPAEAYEYMVTLHDRSGHLVEAGHAASLADAAKYASRSDVIRDGYFAFWRGGRQIAGGKFRSGMSEDRWAEAFARGGIQWRPKRRKEA
jgi:hypothetical protein